MVKNDVNNFFTPSRIIFYVFSIVVFYFSVHYIGKLKDIEKLMLQMRPAWLLLAVSAQIITYLVYASILKLLLGEKPGVTNFFLLFRLSIVIMFVNQILPTGGISGDGYIFKQLIKRKVSRYNAFTAMVLESISYYAAILILLLIFYTWYLSEELPDTILITYTVITGFVFYVLLFMLVLILSNGHNISFAMHKLESLTVSNVSLRKQAFYRCKMKMKELLKCWGGRKKQYCNPSPCNCSLL